MHRRAKLGGNLAEGDRNASHKRVRRAVVVSKEIASLAERHQKLRTPLILLGETHFYPLARSGTQLDNALLITLFRPENAIIPTISD